MGEIGWKENAGARFFFFDHEGGNKSNPESREQKTQGGRRVARLAWLPGSLFRTGCRRDGRLLYMRLSNFMIVDWRGLFV